MTVVYQYKSGNEHWLEVIYSLRSLMNLRIDFDLAFAGDIPPYINPEGILHIQGGSDAGRYLDANHKIYAICRDERVSDPFLLMYDDIYFNNRCAVDLTATPFVFPPGGGKNAIIPEVIANRKIENVASADELPGTGSKNWKESLFQTYKVLKGMELSTWDFETHLPRIVRKQQMLHVIRKFDLLNNPLQRWTCYFNYYLNVPTSFVFPPRGGKNADKPPLLLKDMPDLKAGFYGGWGTGDDLRYERLAEMLERKVIINHNDRGLSKVLKKYLTERFQEPSRWEMASIISQLPKRYADA